MPAPLDCLRKFPLMLGAITGDPARYYLPTFSHETTKTPLVLVIYVVNVVFAEATDLLTPASELVSLFVSALTTSIFSIHYSIPRQLFVCFHCPDIRQPKAPLLHPDRDCRSTRPKYSLRKELPSWQHRRFQLRWLLQQPARLSFPLRASQVPQ